MKKMMMILALLFAMIGSSFGADWYTSKKIVSIQPINNAAGKGLSIACDDNMVYTLYQSNSGTGLEQAQMLACFLTVKASDSSVDFFGNELAGNSGVRDCTLFVIK